MSINNTLAQQNKHFVNHPKMDEVIKSARLFEKAGMIHIDYRVNTLYRKDGKDRTRFSTGEVSTRRAMQRIERDKFAIALSHYLENTVVLDESNLTLGEIALDAINEDKGNRLDETSNDYLKINEIAIKPIFGKKILRDIKVSDIKAWKNDLLKNHKLSHSRYTKYHRTLNFIFKYALENEMIDRNPVSLVDKKSKCFTKSRKEYSKKYYTKTEIEKMLEHATGWFKVMLTLYINTGIRSGEGLALAWRDLDFEQSTITIQRSKRKGILKNTTKNGKNRIIRMSKPLKEALLAYREICTSEEWLFTNEKTGQLFYEINSINKRYFKPLLKKLGIEYVSFYALRHSFASLAVQQGIPMPAIQNQLGHSKLSTTQDYYVNFDLLAEENTTDILDNLYT